MCWRNQCSQLHLNLACPPVYCQSSALILKRAYHSNYSHFCKGHQTSNIKRPVDKTTGSAAASLDDGRPMRRHTESLVHIWGSHVILKNDSKNVQSEKCMTSLPCVAGEVSVWMRLVHQATQQSLSCIFTHTKIKSLWGRGVVPLPRYASGWGVVVGKCIGLVITPAERCSKEY